MGAALGVGIGLSLYSGHKQKKAADKAAGQARKQADAQAAADAKHAAAIKEQSQQEAKKLKAESIVYRGKQVARQATSGALVGDGSNQAMVDETVRLAERDAYTILYNGEQGYLFTMDQSRLNKAQANAQADAYKAQGTASLLSTAGSAFTTYAMLA